MFWSEHFSSWSDPAFFSFILGGLGVLVFFSVASWLAGRAGLSERHRNFWADVWARTQGWWLICAFLFPALAAGKNGTLCLFGFVSWLAMRELADPRPTKTLRDYLRCWLLVDLLILFQYLAVGLGMDGVGQVAAFSVLALAIQSAFQNGGEFQNRASKRLWAFMLCVYCLSFAPALFNLGAGGLATRGLGLHLLLFLLLTTQFSDIFQYLVGKLAGRRRLSRISPNKTWEGLLGGWVLTLGLGVLLSPMMPFPLDQVLALALLNCCFGYCGGLVMSSVKRDRGIKDFSALIPGQGGVMDRFDSLCFAAPLFYGAVRLFVGHSR